MLLRKKKSEIETTAEELFQTWDDEVFYPEEQSLRWLVNQDEVFKEWFKEYEKLGGSEEEYILAQRRSWRKTQNKLQRFTYWLKKRYQNNLDSLDWEVTIGLKEQFLKMFSYKKEDYAELAVATAILTICDSVARFFIPLGLGMATPTGLLVFLQGLYVVIGFGSLAVTLCIGCFYFLPKVFWLVVFAIVIPLGVFVDIFASAFARATK